jgi:branched-chain amino acid transport system substrate-binding protein
LINNYPGFAQADAAIYLAGEIEYERGQYAQAASYFDAVAEKFPLSGYRAPSELSAARSYSRLEMYARSAEILVRLLDSPVDEELRAAAETELQELIARRLSPTEMETLARDYPSSPVNRDIAVSLARFEYANANYAAAYDLLAEFLYRFPEQTDVAEARRLLELSAEKKQPPSGGDAGAGTPPGIVEPNTIGAILPVTGPGQMSLFARYFGDGCQKAVDEFNETSARKITLVTADTKGSAVGAVKSVRKLVLEDGAVALVGAVFTMPTITAAIEANAWQVPMLSPLVSADDLLEIGPWIFETKVPREVEVTAVADLAVTRLLFERIAIVSPLDGRYRDAADLFSDEVTRLGAEVVEHTHYESGSTDFREQLEAVRDAAPDAIFISGDYKELLNLLPQVKFYDLQVQLLGLSNWNNENLLRLFRGELEGALFPLETYRGKDPEVYDRLKLSLEEDQKGEVNSVIVAGYFGTRLLLESLGAGASDRGEVRAYLDGELSQGSEKRMAEAAALTILTVRSGKAVEFTPPQRPGSEQ